MKRGDFVLLMDIIAATAIAFAFLTTLPMPKVDWTSARLRYFPLVLPLAGVVVGGLGSASFWALSDCWRSLPGISSALMTCFYLALTGGLHMDGLADTCDAVFSHQNRETRLEILSDTRVGAFAVMGCAAALLSKTAIFSDLFAVANKFRVSDMPFLLTFIPIYSRIGLGILLYLPFAREDGLARTLGGTRLTGGRFVLIAIYALLTAALVARFQLRCAVVPLTGAAFLYFYGRYCVRTFGGITGDLLGAFVELSEILMLAALAVERLSVIGGVEDLG
jgi:adenosylcobinamide-GDP ribazoletransferase